MRIKIALDSVFVPTWNGNRDIDEKEQVKVFFRFLTGPERDGIYMTEPLEYDTEGKVGGMKIRIEDFYKKMMKTCIKRIENLETEDETGNVVNVIEGEQLFNYGELADLYREVRDFLLEANNPIDKKKLKSDTASWPTTGESESPMDGPPQLTMIKTSEPSQPQYMSDHSP
jgi:hypothetical protein